MAATLAAPTSADSAWLPWLPIAAGLAVLYAPVFYDFARGHWQSEEHAHGTIVLAVVLWLLWRGRAALIRGGDRPARGAGIGLFFAGLVLYVAGRSIDLTIFEAGALLPILAGTLLAMRGWPALRQLWFAVLFVAFLVPLPGVFVDAVTGPLKSGISELVEQLLYAAGYPIGRSGVALTVGPYQLLVADACSGLNSMVALAALGALYLHLVDRPARLHNAVMLAAILPIAFFANLVRVLALVLITYHLGDAAGRGFLHGAAGIVLLLAALGLFVALDALLVRATRQG
jgi:exosortase B